MVFSHSYWANKAVSSDDARIILNLLQHFDRLVASDDTKAMQMQMGMGAGANMGFDAPKAYKQERVNLRLQVHEWALEHAEKKLLGEAIPVTALETSGPAPQNSTLANRKSKYQKVTKRKH